MDSLVWCQILIPKLRDEDRFADDLDGAVATPRTLHSDEHGTPCSSSAIYVPTNLVTPYINTIPVEDEPFYPGDEKLERQFRRWVRWNAAVQVTRAQRPGVGVGGHISSLPLRQRSTKLATTTSSVARTIPAVATRCISRVTPPPATTPRLLGRPLERS